MFLYNVGRVWYLVNSKVSFTTTSLFWRWLLSMTIVSVSMATSDNKLYLRLREYERIPLCFILHNQFLHLCVT